MAETSKPWRKEMVTYFCFTLPYATWPIGYLYAMHLALGHPLRLADLVADGGILAAAIGLNAGAVSRLVNVTKWPELKIVFAGFASFALLFASIFYGFRYIRGATNSVLFVDLCVLVFIVSVVIATFCRFLPEDS